MNISQLNGRIDDLESVMGGVPSDSVPFSIGGQSLSGGGDMDYSDFAFGFSVSGNQVTITVGEVRHGTRVPITATTFGSLPITINTDQTWIYCTYVFGGTSAQVVSSVIEPVTTSTALNYPLHLWGVSDGVVSVARILHLGDIIIPGVFP
jgi:hypothetical protein